MLLRTWGLCVLVALAAPAAAGQGAPQGDAIDRLVTQLQQAVTAGDPAAIQALAAPTEHPATIRAFVQAMTSPKVSRVTIKLRDRSVTVDGQTRLILEILAEYGRSANVANWRIDLAAPASATGPLLISNFERLTVVYGLYRLTIDPTTEYTVHNATIRAPDLTLTVKSGRAFVARSADGVTGMVFLGRGRTDFSPKPEAERGQLRIFCGADSLRADFGELFIRLNPGDYDQRIAGTLTPRTVEPSQLRRANQIFDAYVSKSFQVDLGDMSTARWSLVPVPDDFIAEINMRKYGALTYARSGLDPEDVSLFDRRRRINISIYASDEKLATRGRFYSEDDAVEYDVTHYDVTAAFSPDQSEVVGEATLSIRLRSRGVSTLSLRLADPLVVESVTSREFGRLFFLRVTGQNILLIGFTGEVAPDTAFQVSIRYAGHLKPQSIQAEAIRVQQQPQEPAPVIEIPPEPDYLYSNRAYWYPQGLVTGYATARMAISVPSDLYVVASAVQQGVPQSLPGPPGQRPGRRFEFEAETPLPYLACLISRFVPGPGATLKLDEVTKPESVSVVTNPREVDVARATLDKTKDILTFYTGLMHDMPYDHFTVAVNEANLPGGHSPAYFALLNQPLPSTPFTWGNDPVAFPNYPSFFLAHEVAHQWWGQGIGWKNYHEQWLSEGFAQYFAAMYAGHEHGPAMFSEVLHRMQRWALDTSPDGPVYLGYRLGSIKSDSRVFRALVYDKGAIVLHMLRRLVGDDAFFAGLRDFYQTWRFRKAGTDDLRVAMEKASGLSLGRFFDTWIYGDTIPRVRFIWAVDPNAPRVDVEFDQLSDPIAEFAITVTIGYSDGTTVDTVVPVTDKAARQSIPLRGTVRWVDANRDAGALVKIVK